MIDYLIDRVDAEGDCWIWQGATNRGGYGILKRKGRAWLAHRFVWTELVGSIPAELEMDHLCRTPACVNPDHLEPVTRTENQRRGYAGDINGRRGRAQTHCKHGHEFTELNTYVYPNGTKRQCHTCRRQWYEDQQVVRIET